MADVVFGLDVMLSDKLAIFGELLTSNTTNYLGGNPQTSHETSVSGNFVKETPANYTGTNTSSVILPFSSIGFNVGVKLYLGK